MSVYVHATSEHSSAGARRPTAARRYPSEQRHLTSGLAPDLAQGLPGRYRSTEAPVPHTWPRTLLRHCDELQPQCPHYGTAVRQRHSGVSQPDPVRRHPPAGPAARDSWQPRSEFLSPHSYPHRFRSHSINERDVSATASPLSPCRRLTPLRCTYPNWSTRFVTVT